MMPRRSFLMAALLFGAYAVFPPAAAQAGSSKCEGNPGSLLEAIASFNVDADYTEDYAELPIAVTRQAGTFALSLTTSSNPSRSCYGVALTLVDSRGEGFEVDVPVVAVGTVGKLNGAFTQTYEVSLPDDMPVGAYWMQVTLGAERTASWYVPDPKDAALPLETAVLFNPFYAGSEVYVPGAEGGNGGVGPVTVKLPLSNEDSLTFHLDSNAWEVVDGTLDVIAKLDADSRKRAWRVSREISYRANNEVLWGRWNGSYKEGQNPSYWLNLSSDDDKKPWEWSSSSDIFKSRKNGKAKFGQCMVYACVTTSSLRSVGIPTRLVTNLGSAHESAKSDMVSTTVYRPSRGPSLMTAPSAVVLTKEGTYDAAKSKDVIWNFHVWNESWHLAAPGSSTAVAPEWNAYDSTPQETASSSEAGVSGYPVASIPDVKSCSTCTFVQSKGTEPFPTKVSVSGK